jgi:excisionase family DNA binding protein
MLAIAKMSAFRELSELPSANGGLVAGARRIASRAPARDERGEVEAEAPPTWQERLLTVEEVAERLQYSVDWVRQQVRLGKIPAIRFNARAWRFHWPTVLKALHWQN